MSCFLHVAFYADTALQRGRAAEVLSLFTVTTRSRTPQWGARLVTLALVSG